MNNIVLRGYGINSQIIKRGFPATYIEPFVVIYDTIVSTGSRLISKTVATANVLSKTVTTNGILSKTVTTNGILSKTVTTINSILKTLGVDK